MSIDECNAYSKIDKQQFCVYSTHCGDIKFSLKKSILVIYTLDQVNSNAQTSLANEKTTIMAKREKKNE